MRLAPSVIVLIRDVDGFGHAIADGFRSDPKSNLSRESSSFELSLEKYGFKDRKASGDLIQFVDPLGSPKVSRLVMKIANFILVLGLRNIYIPLYSIFLNPLLPQTLTSLPSQTTLVLPFVMKALKVNRGAMDKPSANEDFVIYTTEIGGTSELTKAMIDDTISAPPSLQIHCESLACLLLMVRILNLPTVLLLASGPRHPNGQSSYPELEVLEKLGGTVARHLGLIFSKDLIPQKNIEKSTSVGEPWRALYG
ncbi:hypothetical protein ZIOFF_072675 [Zingiber officinale]|uniref:DUF7894 domain-containing protein n=1 Tax=Zingiber officinale TaxID=94328 RepID=A0A8J5C8E0_ZINOF|nr:hypothetical protein ZIOFF_072675 [Zingiber officinale]